MDGVRRARWKLEAILAVLFLFVAALTAIDPEWIEAFGIEPDQGNGTVELAIVIGLGIAALGVAALSRRHYLTRPRTVSAGKEARS